MNFNWEREQLRRLSEEREQLRRWVEVTELTEEEMAQVTPIQFTDADKEFLAEVGIRA